MEWQPIETAPKNGTWILAVLSGYIPLTVYWNEIHGKWLDEMNDDYTDEEWEAVTDKEYYPAHWMPLPEAPNTPNEP